MPEPDPQEELTLDDWRDAVKKAGWRVAFVASNGGIAPKLVQATQKRQDYLPSSLSTQLGRFRLALLAEAFGERAADGFRCCPRCRGCYLTALWADVRSLCETSGCPLRSVT